MYFEIVHPVIQYLSSTSKMLKISKTFVYVSSDFKLDSRARDIL